MPSTASEGFPFLVADLRDFTVEYRQDWSDFPETIEMLPAPPVVDWDWSMGKSEYPGAIEEFAYPTLIKAVVDPDLATEELKRWLGSKRELYFRLDPATGDYSACGAEEWVPRDDDTRDQDDDPEGVGSQDQRGKDERQR